MTLRCLRLRTFINHILNNLHRNSTAVSAQAVCGATATLLLAFLTVSCTSGSLNSTGPSTTKCQVSAKSAGGATPAGGGTMTVSVTAEPECAWKASADVSWITDVAPASGQGSADVAVRVAANADPVQRRGS